MHEAPTGEEIVRTARIDEGADADGNDRQARVIYAAGFFDGEGWVSIRDRNGTGRFNLMIGAGQKDIRPLLLMQALYGGSIHGPDTQSMHRWAGPHGEKAADALGEMLPHLRVKDAQARIAIEFQEWRPYYRPRKWSDVQERGREAMRRYRSRQRGEVVEYDGSRPKVPPAERVKAQEFAGRLLAARL